MKIELYSLPDCIHANKIKRFLQENGLPFREIIINNDDERRELNKLTYGVAVSSLKITRNHSIQVIQEFNELLALRQLIENIKKYKPKLQ